MPPPGPDRIVLVGMMGSGKSTVGGILADRLGWPFHDNDATLRQLFNATPRELLASGGEATMHAAELAALTADLAVPPPSIVAAAAGSILDPGARRELAGNGLVVWLRITASSVRRRSARGVHRPWPEADREAWIRNALAEREALYADVADLTLEADDVAPAVLAERVMRELDAPRP